MSSQRAGKTDNRRMEYLSPSNGKVWCGCVARRGRLPGWIARPEGTDVPSQPPVAQRTEGFCVWFTGLSGAGKSTIAEMLAALIMERGRQVTLLDGDVVRTHLSKGLGFSKEDRDTNVLRIGFVASEVVRHRGAVICAAISPYDASRAQVRAMVGQDRFILVYVNTPLDVCERRDPKALYAKARRGEIKWFTGIDDPYEIPINPEIILNTLDCTPEDNASRIIQYLTDRGFLQADETSEPSGKTARRSSGCKE